MLQYDQHECACATSLSFAEGTFLFVFRETRVTSKVLIAFRTGESKVGEPAWAPGHAAATKHVATARL